MCGITGYIGNKEAAARLLVMLQKLEYRGYDSAGVAALEGGVLTVRKMKGPLSVLAAALTGEKIAGTLGIGHTRWATHGEPSDINAHPHTAGRIAVVHNGIIENYAPLKIFLQERGVVFQSETDTEVIVQLLNYYYTREAGGGQNALLSATLKTLSKLEGSYSLGLLASDYPDRIIGARKDSPLIVGLGEGENYLASDVPALLPYTREVHFLNEREIAVLYRDHVDLYNESGEKIIRQPTHVDWDVESAEKGGYAHFMLKEIHEQDKALSDTLKALLHQSDEAEIGIGRRGKSPPTLQSLAAFPLPSLRGSAPATPPSTSGGFSTKGESEGKAESALGTPSGAIGMNRPFLSEGKAESALGTATVIGCGTAYHAGVVGKYAFEHFARLPVELDIASEYRYRNPLIRADDLFIVISQSGETADTLAAMRLAKKGGARILAITNAVGSTLAREADLVLYTLAGPEIAVASTKAFTTQLMCIYLLALRLGCQRGTLSIDEYKATLDALVKIPEQVRSILSKQEAIQKFAARQFNKQKVFFIGRLFDYAIALESALKLKEISYTHSEGFAAGELKHGAIALVDKSTLVVAIATQRPLFDKIISNIREVTSRGAEALVITYEGEHAFDAVAGEVITIPQTLDALSPLLSIIPLQLFAYYCAVQKGNDPDKPRNLAKSVTVE
ncbi:MAG: glutamine--fructose-6-phosphate transaminase (isomerizing) [Spirochaetaceae bacterium]|jgi:glucosamine--fructose-6-phosphate aminotransferase (isomerizing)|nr:glutamine--fructose-6-phosphate transaminase (isomerizing) [Spirochaetaceae bacterium]